VTLRFTKVRHVATGIVIANVLSGSGGAATAGERYSIHDLVFEDIDGELYKGFGSFAIVMSNNPPLRDVKIDHVTAFPPRVSFNIGSDRDKAPPGNFTFTNNILSAGKLEVTSTGGQQNCAFGSGRLGPADVLKNCFSSLVFTHNAIIGTAKQWPAGNFSPKNEASVGFVNYNSGKDGDYHLCRAKNEPAPCKDASPYLQAGTDGKDLGADIDAVESAIKGAN